MQSFKTKLALHLIETSLDIRGGRAGAAAAIALEKPITAILCLSDLLAVGAMFEMHYIGKSVPKDISIMGFDNLDIGTAFSPGLTTMRLGVSDMGLKAADALCTHLSDGNSIQSFEVEGAIIERGSTARI